MYLDDEKTGAKSYHVWFKQLGGTGKLTLTTGKSGATDLVLGVGTYVAIISVDENGNIINVAETPTDTIASGNSQPATSNGVADAISTEATARDNAISSALNNLVENYYTLVIADGISTSAYTTISFVNNRKLSDYDFIDFYVGLYENSIFYPRGFCRVPSFLFKNYTETNRIYRVDIPLVGSNNENVSFRYKSDTSVNCRAFNTSTTFYAKILGEIITH